MSNEKLAAYLIPEIITAFENLKADDSETRLAKRYDRFRKF